MGPEQFEHVLAAAAELTGQDEFVVVGSQAIFGSLARPPESLLEPTPADIYPRRDPGGAALIEEELGEDSQFHLAHGCYAHGAGPLTVRAPRGWEKRLVRREIPPRSASQRTILAWCLEVHDLVLCKCLTGRDGDWDYATEALRAGIAKADVLLARVFDLPATHEECDELEQRLSGIVASL